MGQIPTHRIVIVGGGAGGLELAVRLGHAKEPDVLLLDRDAAHVWKPRLHELAAGLEDQVRSYPFAHLAQEHGFAFQQGELIGIDPKNKQIQLAAIQDADGRTLVAERTLQYEALVLALGGVTPNFGVAGVPGDGTAGEAYLLDTPEDARRVMQRFSTGLLEHALKGASPEPFRVAVVGSGATGIELSACLASDFVCKALAPISELPKIEITMLEAAPEFMPGMDPYIQKNVLERLKELGVDVRTSAHVTGVQPGSVTVNDAAVPANMTIWTTGRIGPRIAAHLDVLATNKKKQWTVRPTLQTTDYDDIFALGDCSHVDVEPVPPTAQVAAEQAEHLVTALQQQLSGAPVPEFKFKNRGMLVSIGALGTVGKFGKDLKIRGRMAHEAYRDLQYQHLYLILGMRESLGVISDLVARHAYPPLKVH